MATQATATGSVVFSSLVQTALFESFPMDMFSQEVAMKPQKSGGNWPSSIKFLRLGSPTVTDLTGTYPGLGSNAGDTLSRTEIELKVKKGGISGANSIRVQNFEEKLHGMTIRSALVQTAKDALMNYILKDIFTRMIRQKDIGNTDYGGEAIASGQHIAWATAGTVANADWLAARAALGINVPSENRYMAYFTDEYADFMGDAVLKPWFQYQNIGISEGKISKKIHGFTPVETGALPLINPATGTPANAAAKFIGDTSATDTRHSMLAWAKEMVGLLIAGVETKVTDIAGGAGDQALEVWAHYYGGVLRKDGVCHLYDGTANS